MPDDIMENMKDSLPEKDFNGAKTLPSDSQSSGSRVVTSQGSRSSTTTITQSKSLVRVGWQYMGLIVRKAVLGSHTPAQLQKELHALRGCFCPPLRIKI